MIDTNALSSYDQTITTPYASDEPYYKKYNELKSAVTKVITTPYSVLEGFVTNKSNDKNNTTQYLNLALKVDPLSDAQGNELVPNDTYIKVKLRGPVKDLSGKVVAVASPEFSAFINMGMHYNPNFLRPSRTWETNWGEVREFYDEMKGLSGIVSFATTYYAKGFNSYTPVFFVPAPSGNMPLSVYEALALKGYRRDASGQVNADFISLVERLQTQVNALFDIDESTFAPANSTPQERAQAIPVKELGQGSNKLNDDPIPF